MVFPRSNLRPKVANWKELINHQIFRGNGLFLERLLRLLITDNISAPTRQTSSSRFVFFLTEPRLCLHCVRVHSQFPVLESFTANISYVYFFINPQLSLSYLCHLCLYILYLCFHSRVNGFATLTVQIQKFCNGFNSSPCYVGARWFFCDFTIIWRLQYSWIVINDLLLNTELHCSSRYFRMKISFNLSLAIIELKYGHILNSSL